MEDYAREISKELAPGERLLWSGQPRKGLFLRGSDAFLIPFSLMWGGFAVFWEITALTMLWSGKANGPPLVFKLAFPLFGLPFVVIGLYLIFGRFFVDRMQRAKTFYGVTNQRIIIHSGLFTRSTKSLNLRTLSDLSLSERPDGSGTISFGPAHPFHSWFAGGTGSWPGARRYSPPCFDAICGARQVYEIIRKAQEPTQ